MRQKHLFLVLALIGLVFLTCAQLKLVKKKGKEEMTQEARLYGVIPKPAKLKKMDGSFRLTPETKIFIDSKDEKINYVTDFIKTQFGPATGFDFPVETTIPEQIPAGAILLKTGVHDKKLGEEGYRLRVKENYVEISGNTAAGVFYGVQTLRQLLPVRIEHKTKVSGIDWTVACCEIEDTPRFTWRGAHLDVCRHFFPKDFVKKYIDILAMHKLNTFHWHLTEDQGWRIEIKKWPKLTEVGAWRADREGITWRECEPQKPGEPATYGGYYTQEEVKEIVAYAESRFIDVVPEIEMPGHARAALAAYPQFSCTGGPFTVVTGGYWPIKDIFCAGNDSTFIFFEQVLGEVMQLFPSKYIHIGGDEAYKENWKNCPKCQQRIKDEGLKDEHELQSYFIRRIEKYLNSKGKILIGWDEILEGGLAPNAVVMSWRGMDGGIAAANAGHDVVMSPTSHCYFDYYQAREGEPEAIGGFLPLEKVYSFEPIPPKISPDKKHHILGAQANVWTEYIATPEHCEYMLLPRLCALAEVVWTPKKLRDYDDFTLRMQKHYWRLNEAGINFRVPTPIGFGGEHVVFDETTVEMINPLYDAKIYYTLDGSVPVTISNKYNQPIKVSGDMVIKARTIMRNGKRSPVATAYYFLVDKDKNGMKYFCYEGKWDSLPDFSKLKPVKKGKCYSFDVKKIRPQNDLFGIVFKGYFNLKRNAKYTFFLNSDDGSKLFIDGKLVVNNDGKHGAKEVSGDVPLKRGMHEFEVHYFDYRGNEMLGVYLKAPGIAKRKMKPSELFVKK